jgi:hypothetical protein
LQRGRGAGFLRALGEEARIVHLLLLRCITHDPRWDSQVEDRSDYYARLCIATGMSLEPLERHLRETPDGREGVTSLAVSTLGRMAALGNGEATDVLREYVAYGPLWAYALDLLAELSDPSALEGLAEVVCARFETGKAMDDNLHYNIFATRETLKPLWQEWSETYPGIARLVGEVQEIYRGYERPQSWPDLRSASIDELLAAADVSNRRQVEKILLSRLKHADVSKYVDVFQTNNPFA